MSTFMTDRGRLHRILDRLQPGLPRGQWFLNGSAVLILNGIETGRPMGDVDVFTTTRAWFNLRTELREPGNQWTVVTPDPYDVTSRCDPPYLEKVIEGLPVHIFFTWRVRHVADIDCNFLLHNAEIRDGYPCASLQAVADWKAMKLRAKDSIDLEAIYRERPDLRPEVGA
jgi:hypothetical protein